MLLSEYKSLNHQPNAKRSGSVGSVLDWDQMVASSSLTAGGVTVLCPYPLLSTDSTQEDPS